MFRSVQVSTGVDTRNVFDKSCKAFTTVGFYEPRISFFEDTVPGSSYQIDCRTFTRLEPMIKPLLSHCRIHNRFFFVPYRSIQPLFERFEADVPYVTGTSSPTIPSVWQVKLGDLRSYILQLAVAVSQDVQYPDLFNTQGGKKNFTSKGKKIFSLLSSLGYNIDTSTSEHDSKFLNAMPILAYAKVWYDFYRNTAFVNYLPLEKYFNNTDFNPVLSLSDLQTIFDAVIQISFERDMFTSATVHPTGVNEAIQESHFRLPDITSQDESVTTVSNPVDGSSPALTNGDGEQVVTKYGLQLVQSLTDFQKRHQLAGIQPFNRILAEYGVALPDEKLNRSSFIGDNVVDVEISDVMSQSYGDETVLGEYAGKGIGFQAKNFRFSTNEFGALICVTTVIPDFSYIGGIKKHCLRSNRLDWFTPTFEHLGTEPVSSAELINMKTHDDDYLSGLDRIFGFLPRYYSYKVPYDCISGNFVLNSMYNSYDGWIMRRHIDLHGSEDRLITPEFTRASSTKVSNPFAMQNDNQFIIAHRFNVKAVLPMHKLYDDYQWSNEDDNPRHVNLHAQGVQLC